MCLSINKIFVKKLGIYLHSAYVLSYGLAAPKMRLFMELRDESLWGDNVVCLMDFFVSFHSIL